MLTMDSLTPCYNLLQFSDLIDQAEHHKLMMVFRLLLLALTWVGEQVAAIRFSAAESISFSPIHIFIVMAYDFAHFEFSFSVPQNFYQEICNLRLSLSCRYRSEIFFDFQMCRPYSLILMGLVHLH